MKRILFLLTCFFPLILLADNVTEQRAREFAAKFLGNSVATRSLSISLEMVYDGRDVSTRANGTFPPFYVFNNMKGKGFVIVSGDDAVSPILGFSLEHNFKSEKMPPNLKKWLDGYADQVKNIRQSGGKPTASIQKEWKGISKSSIGNIIREHETALWGQNAPFNDDCFMLNGQHCVTGCVATATAIVMRFNQWPDQGVGELPAYTFKRNNQKYTVS